MRTQVRFKEWFAANEMTARRSFDHTMGKYQSDVTKPVAILTAWRGADKMVDPATGQPFPEAVRRRLNDAANAALSQNISRRGLSYYPVVGAGQEEDAQGDLQTNKENSFVVQPVGDMDTNAFIAHIQQLLFNPTGEIGNGPFLHSQWGALVKLPSYSQAFLLFHRGQSPSGPQDYRGVKVEGDTAGPRTTQDLAYTQMRYGPRAEPSMMDPTDRPDDVGNPRPDTGKPGAGLPGKRFAIKKRNQP